MTKEEADAFLETKEEASEEAQEEDQDMDDLLSSSTHPFLVIVQLVISLKWWQYNSVEQNAGQHSQFSVKPLAPCTIPTTCTVGRQTGDVGWSH